MSGTSAGANDRDPARPAEGPTGTARAVVFHPAPFFWTDLWGHLLVTGLGALPVLGLPLSWGWGLITGTGGDLPDLPLVLLWLGLAVIVWTIGARPLLTALIGQRSGNSAGLQSAERGDHLEVAFFSGRQAVQVQRFAWTEITGCGVATFSVGTNGFAPMPYVALQGVVRAEVRHPVRLRCRQDPRCLPYGASWAIAADLDRIIRRHVSLPGPDGALQAEAVRQQAAAVQAGLAMVRGMRARREKRAAALRWIRQKLGRRDDGTGPD